MEKLEIYASKKRALLCTFGSAGCVVIGYLFISYPQEFKNHPASMVYLLGWVCISFFGACAIAWLKKLITPKPEIILSKEGIFTRHYGFVEWNNLNSISTHNLHKQEFICIDLIDSKKFLDTATKTARSIYFANKKILDRECIALPNYLTKSKDELLDLIRVYSKKN